MKAFNTTGPCDPDRHYMLDPLARLPEARGLVEQGKYFVVHAPRQTGKTTALAALARELNATGRYAAVSFSCEVARMTGDDVGWTERLVLRSIQDAARTLGMPQGCLPPTPWPENIPGFTLIEGLRVWADQSPRPLVLLFDEIDSLAGTGLESVLSQLRDGYTSADTPFPHAVVLCGMRNVRDYQAASDGDPDRLGTPTPFNVSAASLRIGDFSFADVAELYGQHTAATGQVFTDYAVQRAFEASQGQPWLVNALARDVIEMMRVPLDQSITDTHMEQAMGRLITQRATHLDSLVVQLDEPHIRRFIEPMITGGWVLKEQSYSDDLSYARDLGLVTRSLPLQIANPIYQEAIVQVLAQPLLDGIDADPSALLLPDGRLDIAMLLEEFVAFWKVNSKIIDTRYTYQEAACHLAFMAFCRQVVNGDGFIDLEYGLGRKRLDLAIRKPFTDGRGCRAVQWSAFELKVRTDDNGDQVSSGLEQLDGYLNRLALDTGTLIVFDRRRDAAPTSERTRLTEAETPKGRMVTLLLA
ncbi:ATP-binding protein [Actinomadura hibisca]|uniref:ATP-binding protein n=1 Tax=Actinomadura hibisca TaxID=68565 RepID=UPI001C3F4E0A|nr:ATP-binding protein [Actinomadura hibisca]